MGKKTNKAIIKLTHAEASIAQKIYEFREIKVMLSGDLADLYGVQSRVLNQQVKRNIKRFPKRYMFKLTSQEYRRALRSQNVILKRGQHSKYPPYAFTEHGVLMLATILRSERAEKVSLIIIDTFVKLRALLDTHKDLLSKIDEIERNLSIHDHKLTILFAHLKRLLSVRDKQFKQDTRTRIGFKKDKVS